MVRRHRSYSLECQMLQVAQQYLAGKIPLARLARQHDICRSLIRIEVAKYEAGEFDDEQVQGNVLTRYETRIAELECKVGQLVMENDLLKKARRAVVQTGGAMPSVVSGPTVSRSYGGCRLMNLPRSTYYYRPKGRCKNDEALIARIKAICAEFPRYGYRRVTTQLCHEGWCVQSKASRVHHARARSERETEAPGGSHERWRVPRRRFPESSPPLCSKPRLLSPSKIAVDTRALLPAAFLESTSGVDRREPIFVV